MKGLRGTAFDVFGKTAERRGERQLIADYLALVDEFCATLDEHRLSSALELARLPEEIRGFGHVKERNAVAARNKKGRLLQAYREAQRLAVAA
jgi:indolepyruvate ferredoxin oxidoreductase